MEDLLISYFYIFRTKTYLFKDVATCRLETSYISQSDRYRITITGVHLILSLVVLTIITVTAIKHVSSKMLRVFVDLVTYLPIVRWWSSIWLHAFDCALLWCWFARDIVSPDYVHNYCTRFWKIFPNEGTFCFAAEHVRTCQGRHTWRDRIRWSCRLMLVAAGFTSAWTYSDSIGSWSRR